mgnify:FL=1
MSLKDHLENNELILQKYGDLTGKTLWGKKSFITKNGCVVIAKGTRQKVRGGRFKAIRYTRIYLDDFESELNTQTGEQRDYIKSWVLGAVIPSIDPKRGQVIAIGTIAHEDSFLNGLLKDTHWSSLFYQAIQPDGTSLWPERFSVDYLQKEKETFSRQGKLNLWYREYQNVVMGEEERILRPYQWRGTYNDGILSLDNRETEVHLGITMSIDLGGTGSYTVFEIVGWEFTDQGEWTGYELDTIRGHFPESELIEKLFEAVELYHVSVVSVEKVALQAFFVVGRIYEEMRKREVFFRLEQYTPRGDKEMRLRGLAPLFRAKALFCKPESPTLEEAHWFPRGKYMDCLDALEQATHYRTMPTTRIQTECTSETMYTIEQPSWWTL